MKDDISTPTAEGRSPNAFESGIPGTADRSRAEAAIEDLRRSGGVFVNAVRATRMPMALTDPNLPGNPIVFANASFLELSGYSMEEVLGQQPHFMNGPGTDARDAARFTAALDEGCDDIIETVQYRKDGSRFVAAVLLSAFKDDAGNTLNHFMSWLDVIQRIAAEDELREAEIRHSVREDEHEQEREELRNTRILQDLRARLVTEKNIQTIYDEVLSAAIAITRASAGTVQMLDRETGELVILATRGFSRNTEEFFHRVDARSNTSCGLALRSGHRSYFDFDPGAGDKSARLHVGDGLLSGQSTPLRTRSGEPIGMVSTHWGELGHRATERELGTLDLLARQVADLLEQRAAQETLRESERRVQLLLAELQHRVRNTLAVVRSIARRTADRSDSVEDLLSHFEGRLNAFARIQAAVTRNLDGLARLKSIVEDELVAVATPEGTRLKLKGPELFLKARAAESISLAVHELATNAVKYGALAARNGRINVKWDLVRQNPATVLRFEWTETGLDSPPSLSHEGFGHELLLRSLPYDLGAETSIEFKRDGMRFSMNMPVGPDTLADPAE